MRAHTALLVAVLALPLEGRDDCVLDQAQVFNVPPTTVQVLATYRCGGITCWERWAVVNGKRMGDGRICEPTHGGDQLEYKGGT